MKHLFLTIFSLSAVLTVAMARSNGTTSITNQVAESGVGLGAVIAIVTSWSRNRSVAWAILHGILGWLYVVYFVLTRKPEDED